VRVSDFAKIRSLVESNPSSSRQRRIGPH
jgi:hypothetical protein